MDLSKTTINKKRPNLHIK